MRTIPLILIAFILVGCARLQLISGGTRLSDGKYELESNGPIKVEITDAILTSQFGQLGVILTNLSDEIIEIDYGQTIITTDTGEQVQTLLPKREERSSTLGVSSTGAPKDCKKIFSFAPTATSPLSDHVTKNGVRTAKLEPKTFLRVAFFFSYPARSYKTIEFVFKGIPGIPKLKLEESGIKQSSLWQSNGKNILWELNYQPIAGSPKSEVPKSWVIENCFNGHDLDLVEGIWVSEGSSYEFAIIKNTFGIYRQHDYLGILIDTRSPNWWPGEIILLMKKTASDNLVSAVYFTANKTEFGTTLMLPNENLIEAFLPGNRGVREKFQFLRTYPQNVSRTRLSRKSEIIKTGTGFFISKDTIATNYHIVADSKELSVSWNGRTFPATLLIKDQINDIALLRVLPQSDSLDSRVLLEQVISLPIGDTRKVRAGDKVYTVGFPMTDDLGKRARISEGLINSTVGIEDDPRMFQISVPIQPGNSGSPLINSKGEVVGIVTATIDNAYLILTKGTFPQNINFAIKVNYLNNLVSLLSTEIVLVDKSGGNELTGAQLMESTQSSIVLVEARD